MRSRSRGIATTLGWDKLEKARSDQEKANYQKITHAYIAQQIGYLSRSTVSRFFERKKVSVESAKAIAEFFGLELSNIVDVEQLYGLDRKEMVITLEGSIDELKPKVDRWLQILREASKDETIQIKIMKPGSVVVVIEGSPEGLRRIEELFEAGELQEIAGFQVLDVYPEWEEEPTRLRDWFQGVFTEGWQRAEKLLTPEQLRPVMVWSDRTQRAKFYDLSVDLLQCQVVLLINLIQEEEEKAIANLKVYPKDTEFLPVNLKMTILVEGEVFKEVTARAADVWIQCEFDANFGEEFTVCLGIDDTIVSERFVV
ncbi:MULTISPECIES: DUF1822 family protein [unclassified Roseofilum]|uniref:DUF1822 family protein n=1 Tax=unclassified Roseofilum TaxID=2620099 RepID=UPI001B24DB43|nr:MULTISPECIES: DUF1822 family protein [unclassified Roseofilum]MBP0007150.1 DUF1822 family protein [Roseofilum sp. Belize Diploria]MBP0032088.1 DUF1822 family protein [Roseofilum sp. Belize BBD 4]